MFLLNSIKISFVFALLCCQSCSIWQSKSDVSPPPTPFAAEELKSEIPFSNKEPESFQTEIVITIAAGTEEKFFAAKNGFNRLIVFDYQEKQETAFLQIGENQKYTISPNRKIYAENQAGIAGGVENETLPDFLTAELLNRKVDAKFETLEAENNLARYRVNLDDAGKSEIIIYVDEKIGLPVKQEFYGIGDGQKNLTLSVELRNFSLQTQAKHFELPKDYRKVSPKEFYEILRRDPTN